MAGTDAVEGRHYVFSFPQFVYQLHCVTNKMLALNHPRQCYALQD